MITLLCVLIINYLGSTEAELNSRSVNLALETVLEFDKKDIPSDVIILDDVQRFLARVRSILDESMDARRSHRDSIKFTDFVENALIILRSFSDEDLEELMVVVDDELRKYHYKGCKFYELVQNDDVRSYVTTNLELMRATPAKHLKTHIANAQKKLQNKSFNNEENAFIEYINSLYSGNTSETMYNVLQNLQQYNTASKRSTTGLQKIVKDAIRSVVFDHYSNLNVNARRDLRIKVATYLVEYTGKNKNSSVRFSTMKVEVEGTTPKGFNIEKIHKLLPIRELNDTQMTQTEIGIPFIEARKPFMSLIPEDFTTDSQKKIRAQRSRDITPMIPMQTLWEEARATRKRTWEGHTKKTKMVVREDKPLREILTEHNVVLKVESVHSPSTTTKRKHRQRHNKKHKTNRNTATESTTPIKNKLTKKRNLKKTTPSTETETSNEDTKTTKTKRTSKNVKEPSDSDSEASETATTKKKVPKKFFAKSFETIIITPSKENSASIEESKTTKANKKTSKKHKTSKEKSEESTTKRKLPRKSFGKTSKRHTRSKQYASDEKPKTTKAKRTLRQNKESKNAEDSSEITKKKSPRKSFVKSVEDGISIEATNQRHHLPRFYFRKRNYELSKRSQRRREEHAKLKRRPKAFKPTTIITTTRAPTTSTISTTDSNFILNKINHIEEELENVKHRIDATSTKATKSTRPTETTTTKYTDLPFWERKPVYFLRNKRNTTTTRTTKASEYEEDDDETAKVTSSTPRRVGTANLLMSSAKPAPKTSNTTKLLPTAPKRTKNITTSATTIIKNMVFFRSFENSTFLPIIPRKNDTIAKKLNLIVKFAEVNTKKDSIEQNKLTKGNATDKKTGAKPLNVERKDGKNIDVSVKIKNTTKIYVSNSTIKDLITNATTVTVYGLHKPVQDETNTRKKQEKKFNKTGKM